MPGETRPRGERILDRILDDLVFDNNSATNDKIAFPSPEFSALGNRGFSHVKKLTELSLQLAFGESGRRDPSAVSFKHIDERGHCGQRCHGILVERGGESPREVLLEPVAFDEGIVYSNTEMSLNRGNEEESVGFGFEGLKREL